MLKPINEIIIGERYRKDLGDIEGLARNIAEVGLLHPVVVTVTSKLIAGRRRLEAMRLMGWEEVPVTVVALDDLLKGERSENEERKDFTPSEAVAIGRALEERERERARERQQEHAGTAPGRASQSDTSGNLPEVSGGDTRDIVARAVGLSGRTYEKAKAVVEAAEREPGTFGPVAAEMDETGKVEPAFQKVKASRTGVSKSREAVAARQERMREMATDGYRPVAIASELGIDEATVRSFLHAEGIETVEARIGKSARIDVNRVMDSLVSDATPSEHALAVIYADLNSLDRSRFDDWITGLAAAMNAYRRLRERLEKVRQA